VKFYIRTLGCKLNQLDSARVAAVLTRAGHEAVGREDEAEWVLVNTCTVTAESDRKSRQAAYGVLRGARSLAVLGCSVRAAPGHWRGRLPGSLVFEQIDDLLAHFDAGAQARDDAFPLTSRTRLPVAIQTGCDDVCAFCVTRLARGAHRSLPAETVVRQVREAGSRGVREVVLTGVNVGAWGCPDTRRPQESRLAQLLERLLEETDLPRIRLSSLGPQYLGEEFFRVFASPRICDHLHLSVQSGSPTVLARMARGHGVEEVRRVAAAARAVRADVALTADVIAGFPGESGAEHRETLATLESVGFARLHVFPFSARDGTAAASFPDPIPPEVRRARAAELRALGSRMRGTFLASQHGKPAEVLAEHDGTGLTTNYIRLRVPGVAEGALARATVTPALLADRSGADAETTGVPNGPGELVKISSPPPAGGSRSEKGQG
jgi:threonylcarbamoyladenosine tRNA methylthiotransferase MtaB